MITDGKKWHYLVVKSLSALFRGITSNRKENFYCLNCFCENHDYCYVEISKEDNKILKYNHGEKSMKVPFIIYADLESLLEKMNTCHNILKRHQQLKINKHTPSVYSLFTHFSFDRTKNKSDYYRGKDCMKNFCLDLRQDAAKIINY